MILATKKITCIFLGCCLLADRLLAEIVETGGGAIQDDDDNVNSDDNDDDNDKHLQQARAIFQWVADSEGGHISTKQVVRRETPGNPFSPLSVYATERIEAGEVIARVPWQNIIAASESELGAGEQLSCGLVETLARELKLGYNESKYGPYIAYLNDEADGQIPSSWTVGAQRLLMHLLENETIPPFGTLDWLLKSKWRCTNLRLSDPFVRKAVLLVIQRSDDAIMIPAYDSYNHRNGNWTNTKTKIQVGKYHRTTATKTIEAGQQIHLSYNFCEECGGRKYEYGTAEILRDYGFVENFPQRWHYMEQEYHFDLDYDEDGKLVLTWDEGANPLEYERDAEIARLWFKRQIQRLRRIKNVEWNPSFFQPGSDIPGYQWQMISLFLESNLVAMEMALESMGPSPFVMKSCSENQISEDACSTSPSGSMLSADGSHYDKLSLEFNDLDFEQHTCDYDSFLHAWKSDYYILEVVYTTTQKLVFKANEKTDDLCLAVDGIIHVCSSFRPYLEYYIHTAAQFVETVRRIAIVGGGNSILLQEALKYDDLELVLVLELDQELSQQSSKYFGVPLHFDDPRVEWYFGEFEDSLSLLPEAYWGSFDIVIVDIMDSVVTEVPGILQSLALLSSPDGIFVKNDLYMEMASNIFDYTIELHFHIPTVCDQVLILGSNKVDFLHDPKYQHDIDTLSFRHSKDNVLEFLHDFQSSSFASKSCKIKLPGLKFQQEAPVGLLQIIDADGISFSSNENLANMFRSASELAGFDIIDCKTCKDKAGVLIVIAMKEGYIAARIFQTHKHVGFDIQLWSNVSQLKHLKNSLVKALQASKVISYNIVVGGMTGSTLQNNIAYNESSTHSCAENSIPEDTFDSNMANLVAMSETVPLALTDNATVLVVCGKVEENCNSLTAMRGHVAVGDIIEIFECPGLHKSLVEAYKCELITANKVIAALKDVKNVHLLVFDGTASFEMHQIWNSILARKFMHKRIFHIHSILATWVPDTSSQSWRLAFLDRFLRQIQIYPISRAEIALVDTAGSMGVGILSTQNTRSVFDFMDLEERLQARLLGPMSLSKVALQAVHGGHFESDPASLPHAYGFGDYKLQEATSQKLVGRQVIYQARLKATAKTTFVLDSAKVVSLLKSTLETIDEASSNLATVEHFDIHKGSISVMSMPARNVIAVWDGNNRITMNYFMLQGSRESLDDFPEAFLQAAGGNMETMTIAYQPRGHHVISSPSNTKG